MITYRYPEWSDRKILIDLRNRFATCYQNEDGSIFYIEPQFYTYLQGYQRLRPENYQALLKRMDEIVKEEPQGCLCRSGGQSAGGLRGSYLPDGHGCG
jgi:hypothetical protein